MRRKFVREHEYVIQSHQQHVNDFIDLSRVQVNLCFCKERKHSIFAVQIVFFDVHDNDVKMNVWVFLLDFRGQGRIKTIES